MLFRSMTPRLGRLVLTPPASLALSLPPSRFAGSKAGGSTKNGRDSAPKFLGVKLPGGARVEPGNVIVRQRGQRVGLVAATRTVAFGRDWTVFALQPGVVKYWRDGARGGKSVVEVVRAPSAAAAPGTLEAPDSSALGATSGRTSVERRVSTSAVERYPLVLVEPWELAGLAREVDRAVAAGLPAPSMSPRVAASLANWRLGDARSRSSGGFAVSLRRDASASDVDAASAEGPRNVPTRVES